MSYCKVYPSEGVNVATGNTVVAYEAGRKNSNLRCLTEKPAGN